MEGVNDDKYVRGNRIIVDAYNRVIGLRVAFGDINLYECLFIHWPKIK